MKINTKEAIRDIKGKTVLLPNKEEFTFGEALANILLDSKSGGKMKMYSLAQRLYNDKIVEVDLSDISLIKEAVEGSQNYNNLVLGQVLVYLNGLKETK